MFVNCSLKTTKCSIPPIWNFNECNSIAFTPNFLLFVSKLNYIRNSISKMFFKVLLSLYINALFTLINLVFDSQFNIWHVDIQLNRPSIRSSFSSRIVHMHLYIRKRPLSESKEQNLDFAAFLRTNKL